MGHGSQVTGHGMDGDNDSEDVHVMGGASQHWQSVSLSELGVSGSLERAGDCAGFVIRSGFLSPGRGGG